MTDNPWKSAHDALLAWSDVCGDIDTATMDPDAVPTHPPGEVLGHTAEELGAVWNTYVDALRAADPDHPRLADF